MNLYMWEQNNIRGQYLPIGKTILVEAPSIEEAPSYATKAWGIDFDDSCEGCCGHRWMPRDSDYESIVETLIVTSIGSRNHVLGSTRSAQQQIPMLVYGTTLDTYGT